MSFSNTYSTEITRAPLHGGSDIVARFFDFFGFGPKRKDRRDRDAAIQSKIQDVVHLSHALEKDVKLHNAALDLQKAIRRQRRRGTKR